MKLLIYIIIAIFLSLSVAQSSVVNELERLSNLYQQGKITEEQFEKAKDIILKIEKNNKKKIKEAKKKKFENSVDNKNNIIIRQFTKQVASSDKFEKMEMIVGDFRIFTHRPGGMKIKQISDGKQLAVYGDSMRVKYYNNSEKFFKTKMVN